MTSTQIFELAGLHSHLIGEGKSDQSLSRWKRSYKDHGEDVLLQETRGSKNNGPCGPRKQLSLQEALDKANARIAYLEENLELIKKLEQHERSVIEMIGKISNCYIEFFWIRRSVGLMK
ncbi:hypothetical protein OZ415_06795 [Aerococcus urinaeequi]|uniref:Uncharacterized protein n=1 Tax=Aerococcus urinaeequi TaxID=51665 RepID=A0AA47J2Y9_9LACT|nr:hypothetical protein [Aerococcus urinaeequi]WAT23967.1 hypothetical protein OZ415_06795 [Aerococcus urinaeequi]